MVGSTQMPSPYRRRVRKGTHMSLNSDRTDISTEPSPGPEEHDNLGTEDG